MLATPVHTGLEQNGLKVDIKTQDKSDQGVDMTETEDSTVTLAEVCNTTDTPSLGMAALPNAAKKVKRSYIIWHCC